MNLGQLYRDTNSVVAANAEWQEQIFPNDTINAINDAIASLRVQYIQNGLGYEFADTESLTPSSDSNYPFNSVSLSNALLRSLPIHQTVLNTSVAKTADTVTNGSDTYTEDQLVRKDNVLYQVTEDVTADIYTSTFDETRARNFATGVIAKVDDIFYNDGSYYKANSAYTIASGDDPDSLSEFDKVYLREIGNAYVNAMIVSFDRLHELSLSDECNIDTIIAIQDDTLFSSTTNDIVVTYIPEWTYVTDLSTELDIPDTLASPVKRQAIQLLATKLGVEVPQVEE